MTHLVHTCHVMTPRIHSLFPLNQVNLFEAYSLMRQLLRYIAFGDTFAYSHILEVFLPSWPFNPLNAIEKQTNNALVVKATSNSAPS